MAVEVIETIGPLIGPLNKFNEQENIEANPQLQRRAVEQTLHPFCPQRPGLGSAAQRRADRAERQTRATSGILTHRP